MFVRNTGLMQNPYSSLLPVKKDGFAGTIASCRIIVLSLPALSMPDKTLYIEGGIDGACGLLVQKLHNVLQR